jgi:hypothetical protein
MRQFESRRALRRPATLRLFDQYLPMSWRRPPAGFDIERSTDGRAVLAAWLLFAMLLAPSLLSLLIAEAAAHLR